MEKNEEKKGKGKKIVKNLAVAAVIVGICYEIFGRKGQDAKNACSWVKNKIQNRRQQQPPTRIEVESNQNQNRQPNNGGNNWKQQQQRKN